MFTARFAYYYKDGLPKTLLSGKAAVIVSTGSPRIVTKFIYKDGSIKLLTRDTLKFCGIKAKGFAIDNATKLTDKQKGKIAKKVKNALDYLS